MLSKKELYIQMGNRLREYRTSLRYTQEHTAEILEMSRVFIHDVMYDYVVRLATATRTHPLLELGISPRGTLALCNMAKAVAFLEGREYVGPKDVKLAFPDVVLHRIRLNAKARVSNTTGEDVIGEILGEVREPVPGRKAGKKQ